MINLSKAIDPSLKHNRNGPDDVNAPHTWWWLNGNPHRYYGPAMDNLWWCHGKCVKKEWL